MYKQKQIWVPKRDFRKTVILNAAAQSNKSKATTEDIASKQAASEALSTSVSYVKTHRRRRSSGSKRRQQLKKEALEFDREEWQDFFDNLDMSDDPWEFLRVNATKYIV